MHDSFGSAGHCPTCGDRSRSEIGVQQEVGASTVRARLSFFQNYVANNSHRNHFMCGATRQAQRIRAIGSPNATACALRVGATSYDTGADIIQSIVAANACTQQLVDSIHVFSHGYEPGIPGTTAGQAGLYFPGSVPIDRAAGGRVVTDIPLAPLAQDLVVKLHGCNMAAGAGDNFARSLYRHLATSLSNPKVYGHVNTGCAGRDNSWREYSNAFPNGRNLGSVPNIASTGCCGP